MALIEHLPLHDVASDWKSCRSILLEAQARETPQEAFAFFHLPDRGQQYPFGQWCDAAYYPRWLVDCCPAQQVGHEQEDWVDVDWRLEIGKCPPVKRKGRHAKSPACVLRPLRLIASMSILHFTPTPRRHIDGLSHQDTHRTRIEPTQSQATVVFRLNHPILNRSSKYDSKSYAHISRLKLGLLNRHSDAINSLV